MKKTRSLFFAVVGIIAPLAVFGPWVMLHGLNLTLFFEEAWANRVSQFFVIDVLVSAIVLLTASADLTWRKRIIVVIATLCIGVSAGLPLWLALRQDNNTAPESGRGAEPNTSAP